MGHATRMSRCFRRGPSDACAARPAFRPPLFSVEPLENRTLLSVSLERVAWDAQPEGRYPHSAYPSLSHDGRFLGLISGPNIPDPEKVISDVYWRDLQSGTDRKVSVIQQLGTQDREFASITDPSTSDDGRYVAFWTRELDSDGNATGKMDVWWRDVVGGVTRLVSAAADGTGMGDGDSFGPSVSADGRLVAFLSNATNLTTDGSGACRRVRAGPAHRRNHGRRQPGSSPSPVAGITTRTQRSAPTAVLWRSVNSPAPASSICTCATWKRAPRS